MDRWQLVEITVGFFLVVVASAVIVRPTYRSSRVLLGIAVAAWAGGLLGVVLGIHE